MSSLIVRHFAITGLVACLLPGASFGQGRATAPQPAPTHRIVDTLMRIAGKERRVERGTVSVPERRGSPGSEYVQVSFVRLKSTAASPGNPVIFLPGSPGGAAGFQHLSFAALTPFFDVLRASGDVVVMDYRGSGLSTPRLDCPRYPPFPADMFASRENAVRFFDEQARRCAAQLKTAGRDIAGYTWAEVAADVDDLRRALGARAVDLVGFSSGTQAALATVRAYPSAVGHVALLGTEGPDHSRKLPAVSERQIDIIGTMIRDTPELRKQIPDFRALMTRVLERAERTPIEVAFETRDGTKMRGTIGRFALEYITSKNMSGPDEFDLLPSLYYTLDQGDVTTLSRVLQGFTNRPTPGPLAYVMDGASGVSPARAERIKEEEPRSLIGRGLNFPFPDIAQSWGYRDLGAPYRAPIVSSVPALFITGEFDGNTPFGQAEEVRKGFARSTHLRVRNAGHLGVLTSTDVARLVVSFLRGDDVSGAALAVEAAKLRLRRQ